MKHHLILTLSIAALLANVKAESQPPVPATIDKDSTVAVVTIEDKNSKDSQLVDLERKIDTTLVKRDNLRLDFAGEIKPSTWLGVAVDSLTDEVAAQLPVDKGTGLLVRHVVPASPAALAGLQDNDVLTLLDNQILVNGDQFRTLITTKKGGDNIRLTYLRKGKQAELTAKLIVKDNTVLDVKPFPVIDIEGGLKVVGDILKLVDPDKIPLTIRKRITVEPDGKITATDPKDGSEVVINPVEAIKKALKDAGMTDEAMSKIQEAVLGALEGSKKESSAH